MNLAEYRATVAKVPNAFLQHVVYDGLDAGVSRASGVPRSQVEIFAGGATRVQQLKIDVGCLIHLLLDHVVVALDLLRVAFPYTRNHFGCSVQGHRDGARADARTRGAGADACRASAIRYNQLFPNVLQQRQKNIYKAVSTQTP